MEKVDLKIAGMHCAGCATGIEKGLAKVEGIEKAQVNFATATARVEYIPGTLKTNQILEEVSKLGYKANINTDNSSDTEQENFKARQKFLLSLTLTLPVLVISMREMLSLNIQISQSLAGIILFLLTLPVLIYPGRDIFNDALGQLKRFRANMNSLIALGSLAAFLFSLWVTVASLFNFRVSDGHYYFDTAAMIITLILLGRFLESRAKNRARDAIGAILRLRPKKAIAVINGEEIAIELEAVQPKMILLVRPGDKVPADGIIIEGNPSIDESLISGESVPVDKKMGDKIVGGSVNGNSSFKLEVTDTGENSFLAGVIRLISEAQNRKAPIQSLADKIAGIFVPLVLLAAILTFVIWYLADPDSSMLLTAPIAVLIIACPCALGLATPTAILTGTGWAARRGIYIRGGDILENIVNASHVIFDKTGTLTEGRFEVKEMKTVGEDNSEKDINKMLQLAASAESGSSHPLARAIVEKATQLNIKILPEKHLTELPGFGIKAEVAGSTVLVGNEATMKKDNVSIETLSSATGEEMDIGHTIVYVAADGLALGFLSLSDKIRDEASQVLNEINSSGRKVVILTGDNFQTARGVAKILSVGYFEAGIKPHQKAIIVDTLRKAGNKVMMVGDGINDAPALAAADIGVALGSGTDVAIESADVILVRDDLGALLEAINISRLTYRTIKQNLFWAFGYNVIAIPIAAGLFYPVFGLSLSPIVAAAAMAFSSVFVVTNSLRLLKSVKG